MESTTLIDGGKPEEHVLGARWRPARAARLFAAGIVVAGLLAVATAGAVGWMHRPLVAQEAAVILAESVEHCTDGLGNCNVTKCCKGKGLMCYKQDNLYAQCRVACTPGPDPTHWDEKQWSCQTLGKRTPGKPAPCAQLAEDCGATKCCAHPGSQCFQKNASYARCKPACIPGAPDTSDVDGGPWSCKRLGPFAPGAQGWVWQKCAKAYEACTQKKCCIQAGEQCFAKDGPASAPYYAECKPKCKPGEKPNPWEPGWKCTPVGSRTPESFPQGGKLAPWAVKTCSKHGENCTSSKCCLEYGSTCFEKNTKYATCRSSCTPGKNRFDHNETWSCKELGPRSFGLALKGSPSLFCFSLFRTKGYERTIMEGQLKRRIGIFGCDEAAVLSTDNVTTLGQGPHGPVKSIKVVWAPVRTTLDGTAGNAKLFANMWDTVIADGTWRNHAWSVKADPDAVVIAERLRWHLGSHSGQKVYVLNCNAFPSSPNFPMMYGSVEVFGYKAMEALSYGKGGCRGIGGGNLETMGEDYYMGKCMDLVKVGRISDYTLVSDSACTYRDCNNGWTAAFHALKDWGQWIQCHDQAMAKQR